MPARDPRDLFSLHETMRTLRPRKRPRARAIGVSLLALGLAAPLSFYFFAGALSSEQRLASVRENMAAAAASVPSLMDSAVSSIYRTLCPIFTDCKVAQIASTATATVKTSRPVRKVLGAASSTASVPQSATTGPAQSATPAASPHTTVIERIVERALPSYSLTNTGGITEDVLNDRLNQLDNKLSSQIFSLSASLTSIPNSLPASGGVTNNLALSQRIDNLSGTTISNPVITGGSISGTSIAGTITNAISSAIATIDSLTSTAITATNVSFTNATTTNLAVTGTATSTFSGGITIEGGCLSVNGACLTSGASLSGGTAGLLAAWTSATEIAATSSPTAGYFVATSSTASILPYASSTAITAGNLYASALWGSAFTSCSGSNDKLLYNSATGLFSCGNDLTGGSGGTDVNLTFFNGSGLRPSTTTNQVLIGGTSTTSLSKFEVQGGAKIDYASTTAITVSGTAYFGTATTTVLNANTASIGSLSLGSLVLGSALDSQYGGTGISNPSAAGVLLGSYAGGNWQQLATSSLGLLTTNVAEGSNLYFTDARADARINATTSIGTLTAAPNLGTVGTSLTGFLKATAGVLSTALIDLASNVTGLLPVGSGGTGWGNIETGTVLLGNATGALATTTRGNLTETGSSILTITGGGNALLGSGASIQVAQASGAQSGFLASADWTTFNSKQAALGFTPADSALTISTTYPLQGGGSLSADRTLSLAFGTTTSNTWAGLQSFGNATSTLFSATTGWMGNLNLTNALTVASGGTGTTTWQTNSIPYFNGTHLTEDNANLAYNGEKLTATNASTSNLSAGTSFFTPFASAVMVTDANKLATAATTQTCANQFIRSLSAAYIASCASVGDSDFTGQLGAAHGGTGLDTSGSSGIAVINSGVWSASSTLAVYRGGTGAATLTGLLQGNGASAITGITGTAGQFPYYNGASTLLATSSLYLAASGNI